MIGDADLVTERTAGRSEGAGIADDGTDGIDDIEGIEGTEMGAGVTSVRGNSGAGGATAVGLAGVLSPLTPVLAPFGICIGTTGSATTGGNAGPEFGTLVRAGAGVAAGTPMGAGSDKSGAGMVSFAGTGATTPG
jgi:hypothetical protein